MNVALQVLGASQSLVNVKVTVVVPPQAFGAPVLLLLNMVLHPPVAETEASQVANLVSICACV